MFYLLAILSMIGYGVQTSLLAHLSRKMDALDMTLYRNFSFIVTLSPLLLFVNGAEIAQVFQYWPQLLIMGVMAVLALWGVFISFRYLPIGIVFALRSGMVAIFVALMGYLFLAEMLSIWAIGLIILAIIATVFLAVQKNHMPHLNEKALIGILSLLLTAIPASVTVFMAGWLSRQVHPFVAGYFWEAAIALMALLAVMLRCVFTQRKVKWLGWKEAGKIALAAWPTLIGTGAFTLAASQGPIAIVSAIGLASTVVATLMAHYLFHEKLNTKQWLGMIVVLLIVAGMKFV